MTEKRPQKGTKTTRKAFCDFCAFLWRSFVCHAHYSGLHIGHPVHLSARPSDFDGVGLHALPEAEGKNPLALRQITRATAQHLSLRLAACRNTNDRAKPIAIGLRAY